MGSRGVVLVTGGGKRLGREMVLSLAGVGWSVVVHAYRSRREAEEVVEEVCSGGGCAGVVYGSLAGGEEGIRDLYDRARGVFGEVTVLVNSASVFYHDRLGTLSEESFYGHVGVNLLSPVLLCRAFAEGLPGGVRGSIVNLLDQKLLRLTPDFFSYTLSKVGLWAVTEMLAIELAPWVRVNGIAPGLVLRSGAQSEGDFERKHGQTLLGLGPVVGDITRTLLYILDTPCLTGQMIVLDGGRRYISDAYRDDVVVYE